MYENEGEAPPPAVDAHVRCITDCTGSIVEAKLNIIMKAYKPLTNLIY